MTKFKEEINRFLEDEEDGIYDLVDQIYNLPLVGIFEEENNSNVNNKVEFEPAGEENFEIEIYDNFAHISMGGDWQSPVHFDIVLVEDSYIKSETNKLFVAINISSKNKLSSSRNLFKKNR